MNTEPDIKLSSSSSEESLEEGQQRPNIREAEWNKKGEDEEIIISGSKEEPQEAAIIEEPDILTSSRSESMAQEVRRLRSATLDRMGKMLKIHSKSNSEKPEVINTSVSSEDTSRKQRFNSLTRMLRFADKEDKSQAVGESRGRSLTRMLRRKVPAEGNTPQGKPDTHVRNIFSRILGQIRGRGSKLDRTKQKCLHNTRDKPIESPQMTSKQHCQI